MRRDLDMEGFAHRGDLLGRRNTTDTTKVHLGILPQEVRKFVFGG